MLNTEDKILIEQRITNDKPSVAVAYLLLIFLGVFGAHRFYLGRTGSGVAMLLISLTILGLIITCICGLIDLFLVPGMVREKVDKLRNDLTLAAMSSKAMPPSGALQPAG
jgi:TM2 domain-containing membrane protein YozV